MDTGIFSKKKRTAQLIFVDAPNADHVSIAHYAIGFQSAVRVGSDAHQAASRIEYVKLTSVLVDADVRQLIALRRSLWITLKVDLKEMVKSLDTQTVSG